LSLGAAEDGDTSALETAQDGETPSLERAKDADSHSSDIVSSTDSIQRSEETTKSAMREHVMSGCVEDRPPQSKCDPVLS